MASIMFACTDDAEIDNTIANKHEFKEIQKVDWLLGNWKMEEDGLITIESWDKNSDSSMKGFSYSIEGKDTISSEQISLIEEQHILYYIPTVTNQNQGKPISFKANKVNVREIVFENLAHDFPTKISYMLLSEDSLLAEISGKIHGISTSRRFPMTRIK